MAIYYYCLCVQSGLCLIKNGQVRIKVNEGLRNYSFIALGTYLLMKR